MKKLINFLKNLFVISILLCSNCYGDELKHIIKDTDIYGENNWEETKCIDGTYNHLFIDLTEDNWKKIIKDNTKNRRAYFQADFCIRCRLIPIRCSGNDWFRYIITK